MTDEEKIEQAIQALTSILETTPFSVEFKVKKKPAGIKVIIEVTQEQMDGIANQTLERTKRIERIK